MDPKEPLSDIQKVIAANEAHGAQIRANRDKAAPYADAERARLGLKTNADGGTEALSGVAFPVATGAPREREIPLPGQDTSKPIRREDFSSQEEFNAARVKKYADSDRIAEMHRLAAQQARLDLEREGRDEQERHLRDMAKPRGFEHER